MDPELKALTEWCIEDEVNIQPKLNGQCLQCQNTHGPMEIESSEKLFLAGVVREGFVER